MKIALITKRLSNSLGGAERVSVNLGRQLSASGHEVHIFTGSVDAQINGAKVHEIRTVKWLSPLRLLSFQRQVREMLKNEKFDLVYSLCQVYPVHIYRVGDGIHRHWMRLRHPNTALRWLKYSTSLVNLVMVYLENRIMSNNNCRFFIANSLLIKNQLMEYFSIPADRIAVIYNGVDHAVFNPDVKRYRLEMRTKYQIQDNEVVLLHVSNNWERKGLATIIEAMAKAGVEGTRLVIAGRGKKERYISLSRSLGLEPDRLFFTGRTENIEKNYGMSDIFILPTRYEPFSNVCLEAMACGLPVITTKDNGASELIINNQNGFILNDWKDSDSLAAYIKILNDKTASKEMGENACMTAKGYTWERHMEEVNRVFNHLAQH